VNVTKPALYRAFGDKSTLLLKAVEHYAITYGAPLLAAFQTEPDIRKAVTAFCEAAVDSATGEARGCMMVAAALGQSERVAEIRSFLARSLTASADVFAQRFEREMKTGNLARTPSAKVRSRALIDLIQGLRLRAKAGIARDQLLQDARSYVSLILGT
jgi:AcrR family transcriptional regulator